jgi:mono/diheme cytochrome c family protein
MIHSTLLAGYDVCRATTYSMRTIRCSTVILFGFALGTSACGDPLDPEVSARASWYQQIAPILSEHCVACHSSGGIGPFPLDDYATAKSRSATILEMVQAGTMPPFDAREEAECTPRFGWVGDPRLSANDKATIQAWIEDGHAVGAVADIPPPQSQELSDISRTLIPDLGFVTSGSKDQFICFVLDPGVTQPVAWLTGLQVRPDLKEVVHHAVISEVVAGPEQDALVAARGIGRPFDCGTAAPPSNFVVHIWTPGNQPMQTQPEIAVPITSGAKLVMQIHYHPAGGTHRADKTAVDLQFSSTWPRKMYFVTAIGNEVTSPNLLPGPADVGGPQFKIPRNVADHPEHMRVTIPSLGDLTDVRLFSANPHMHLVGTHISATIERPAARGDDPKTECLANGNWNFDWQRTYTYDTTLDKLPSIAAGDIVDIKCRWNNTISNPFVQRMLIDSDLPPQPIDITIGEQTTNEMCLEIFGLAINAPARPTAINAPFAMPDMSGLGLNLNLLK